MATRWRWPPDRLLPRSPTIGVIALRQLQDKVVSASERCRSDHSVHRYAGLGKRDVVPDRTVEQNVLLQHDT